MERLGWGFDSPKAVAYSSYVLFPRCATMCLVAMAPNHSKFSSAQFKYGSPISPPTPPPPPAPIQLFNCGWCNLERAEEPNVLCPVCQAVPAAQQAWLDFQEHLEEAGAQVQFSVSEEAEEELEELLQEEEVAGPCRYCATMTHTAGQRDTVVNGVLVTERVYFCNVAHMLNYTLLTDNH